VTASAASHMIRARISVDYLGHDTSFSERGQQAVVFQLFPSVRSFAAHTRHVGDQAANGR